MSASAATRAESDRLAAGRVVLIGLFITALTAAQVTASKLLALPRPIPLPAVNDPLVLPGAALAYALTFFASDCYAELYGRRAAQVVVNVGFAMTLVLTALVWSTIWAPAADPAFAAKFRTVLGASAPVVLGSLGAYLISQNWDVLAFHYLRELTDGRHLWLRNVGSTATSQLIDTVIFVGVAFVVAPSLLGVGSAVPLTVAATLVVSQYLLKLLIAIVDTPLVYATVGLLGSADGEGGRPAAAD